MFVFSRNNCLFNKFLLCLGLLSVWIVISRAWNCLRDGTLLYGMYLDISSFGQISQCSVYACAVTCYAHTICRSFNFHKPSRKCFLNFGDEILGLYFTRLDPDFIYSNSGNWSKSIAGACQDHECNRQESCKVTRNGSAVCEISPFYDVSYRVEFVLSTTKRSWSEAVTECAGLYGNLAVVDTKNKSDMVEKIIRLRGVKDYVWLGATDAANESQWVWVDGKDMTFSMWSSYHGQPNNFQVQNCLATIYKNETDYWNWFDDNCSWKHYFLCEKVIVV